MSFLHVFAVAFVLMLPLTFLIVRPLESAWRRRHEPRKGLSPRRAAPLTIPSADETAASIERFKAAVRRFYQEESKFRALTETASGAILRRRTNSSPGEPRDAEAS